jgi:hypothetical protein
MKQAQSKPTQFPATRRWPACRASSLRASQRAGQHYDTKVLEVEHLSSWSVGQSTVALLYALWFVLALPFRLVFWAIAWLGRLTAFLLGFALMVVGIALWAGPFYFIGIPLFLVGLVLTLRCLD